MPRRLRFGRKIKTLTRLGIKRVGGKKVWKRLGPKMKARAMRAPIYGTSRRVRRVRRKR